MPDLEIIFKTKAELAGAITAREALEHQLGAAKALGQATIEFEAKPANIAGGSDREESRALASGQEILAPTTPTHPGEPAESAPANAAANADIPIEHDLPRRQLASHRQEFPGHQSPEPAASPPGLDPRPAAEQINRGVPTAAVSQAIQSAADTVTGELQDLRRQLQAFFADMTKTLSAIQDDVKAAQDWIATHLS